MTLSPTLTSTLTLALTLTLTLIHTPGAKGRAGGWGGWHGEAGVSAKGGGEAVGSGCDEAPRLSD